MLIALLALLSVSLFVFEKQGEVAFLDAKSASRAQCFSLSRAILFAHAAPGSYAATLYAPIDFNLLGGTVYLHGYACGYFGVVVEGAYPGGAYRLEKSGKVIAFVPI